MAREDRVVRRENPRLIVPGVQAVIMVGMYYWPGRSGFPIHHDSNRHNKGAHIGDSDTRGVISSYAWGEDYHKLLQQRLKSLAKHLNKVGGGIGRFYVDTGAILERDFAERAGLGFIGKNTLLINSKMGSGFFIGELFTTVALPLDGDEDVGTGGQKKGKPGCGKCTKCSVACPTGAIVKDFVVDARRCISYLTIELKGSIPEDLRAKMGNKVYGCDICQQVCPWNNINWTGSKEKEAFSPLFGSPSSDVTTPKLVELLRLDETGFQKRFAGSAIRRIGRERMARNAAVALGNVGGKADVEELRRAASRDESAIVREHAQWAVDRIHKMM